MEQSELRSTSPLDSCFSVLKFEALILSSDDKVRKFKTLELQLSDMDLVPTFLFLAAIYY